MSLLQLLQEASSLGLTDLKKAMQKDKRVAPLFKTDTKLENIADRAALLATVKYYLLNNENVRKFVASRDNVKDLNLKELSEWRKLRADELTEDKLEWLKDFVKLLFKEHTSTAKGTLSREARKEIDEFVNSNSKYHNLRGWIQKEIASVPGIRPTKRVLLYRGVLFSEYALKNREKYDGTLEKGEGLKFLQTIRKGGRTVDLTWDRPSSWTTSREVARRFAMYGPASSHNAAMMDWFSRGIEKRHIDGALGYVISTFANPEDVLIDVRAYNATVHHQHGNEGEMILKPGEYLARVVEKHVVSGEVDPDQPDVGSDSPALKAVDVVKQLAKDIEPLEEIKGVTDRGFHRVSELLSDIDLFKTLVSNSTTTKVMHAFDKLMEFYKKELGHLSKDDVRADKYAHDEAASKAVASLKDFLGHFGGDVNHSKLTSADNPKGKGKKHQLSAEDYRSTLTSYDLRTLEKDLLTRGRITDRTSTDTLHQISRALGLPAISTHTHQMGAAKQEPIINSVLDGFYKKVGVDRPSEKNEAIKGMINLLRKGYRNAAMLRELHHVHETLKEFK